ncbi:MAG: PqqD family protein [Tistrella sp.]|uniref:PqqD family protein n=1 Tax=Tistrella mobilis TaxID=171437 RepID=A0A3B9IUB4_9PROT|nr:PqqD family protein [Tistrella sp.]MAD37109.1 PqqD family protein [Tistrella sp.]MBA74590.1 PqqD family protein [Tistrella sp.]HAE51396.1 PqqD family protein [Tistrella mobilis]
MIELSSVVSANPDLLATETDGELIMMDMEQGRYFNLNRISAEIWRELERPRNVTDLCRSLGERYDASAAEIERDVLDLLGQMEDQKLIRIHG